MRLLIIIFIFFIAQSIVGQKELDNSEWIGKNNFFIQLTSSKVKATSLSFLDNFQTTNDTLIFTHDYYGISISEDDKKTKRIHFELPNSYFKYSLISKDTLILKAINPSAYFIIQEITDKRYHHDPLDFIKWGKSNKKPDNLHYTLIDSVILVNKNTLHNDRKINKIRISTKRISGYGITYLDFEFDLNGNFRTRIIDHEYEEKKPFHKYHKGLLNQIQIAFIDSLFSYSGITDTGMIDFKQGYINSSHPMHCIIEINHTKGNVQLIGKRFEFPDIYDDFINYLLYGLYGLNQNKWKTNEKQSKFELTQWKN